MAEDLPKKRRRGNAVGIKGLPPTMLRLFRRAVALSGMSQSAWLKLQVRKLIRDQQEEYGRDLLQALTDEEKDLLEVIASGAAEIQQITAESLLPEKRVEAMLSDLIERGLIEARPKGGKTAQARGAVVKLYFVRERK